MTSKPPAPKNGSPPAGSPPAGSAGAAQDDPDAPPSREEVAAAEALRRALSGAGDTSEPSELADLARSVALAHAPRPIDPAVHQAIVQGALAGPAARAPEHRAARSRGAVVIRLSFAAGGALALAAAVALVVGGALHEAPVAAPAAVTTNTSPLFVARTTQPLFDEPFAAAEPASTPASRSTPAERRRPGGTLGSARIDRIAMARAGDFRENEFSRWGTR